MSKWAIAIGVIGVGAAGFLLWRGHQQQQIALAQTQAANAGGVPASGGGAAGLANRLWSQWKSDPLGIQNTKALVSGVGGVAVTGIKQVGSVVSDIGHSIASIF